MFRLFQFITTYIYCDLLWQLNSQAFVCHENSTTFNKENAICIVFQTVWQSRIVILLMFYKLSNIKLILIMRVVFCTNTKKFIKHECALGSTFITFSFKVILSTNSWHPSPVVIDGISVRYWKSGEFFNLQNSRASVNIRSYFAKLKNYKIILIFVNSSQLRFPPTRLPVPKYLPFITRNSSKVSWLLPQMF